MRKRNVNDAVEKFLSGGGEVTRLKSASDKDIRKSNYKFLQRDKALSGSAHSAAIVAREKEKESTFIFSVTERWEK